MPQPPHHLQNDLKCVEWDVKPCSIKCNLRSLHSIEVAGIITKKKTAQWCRTDICTNVSAVGEWRPGEGCPTLAYYCHQCADFANALITCTVIMASSYWWSPYSKQIHCYCSILGGQQDTICMTLSTGVIWCFMLKNANWWNFVHAEFLDHWYA